MNPIEVDAVGLQALQALLERPHHRLAAVAGSGEAALRVGALGEFGAEDEVVAARCDKFAEQTFRLTELVTVRCIDEVAARLKIAVIDAAGFVSLGAVSPFGTEHAGAEDQLGDAQASVPTKELVPHCSGPPGLDMSVYAHNVSAYTCLSMPGE